MSFNEVIYQEPNYEEPRTSLVFDPEIIPIRSCLRPEDDLQSCYGPVQKKSVAFSDYFTIITFGSCVRRHVWLSELVLHRRHDAPCHASQRHSHITTTRLSSTLQAYGSIKIALPVHLLPGAYSQKTPCNCKLTKQPFAPLQSQF